MDAITLNDGQNQDCLVSNFCKKTLGLQCEDRGKSGQPLKLSGDNAWDAVCGSLNGQRNRAVVLNITGGLHYCQA